MGETDGQPKDADWAAAITGVPADTIRALARRMAATRTMVTASWSLQRAHHGEQPYWAVILLASALGQIGLPGGGFGFGYGSGAGIADAPLSFAAPAMDGIKNPINVTIPAARISDCLLQSRRAATTSTASAATIPTSGWSIGPAAIRSIIIRTPTSCAAPGRGPKPSWCTSRGGPRPRATPTSCCRRPRRWSATTSAARAATSSSSPCSRRSSRSARRATTSPSSASWRSGSAVAEAYTQGRDENGLAAPSLRAAAATAPAPTPRRCRTSIRSGNTAIWKFPPPAEEYVMFGDFRADPEKHKLRTPSGKIELYSEKIAGFGYDDCPPHPTWIEPWEWLGGKDAKTYPLHLVSSQPRDRLHSQMDCGPVSAARQGRGPRGDHDQSGGRESARHQGRRRGARAQRARRVPRRRHRQRHHQRRRGEAVLRRLVRSGRRRRAGAVPARQCRMC